MVHHYFHIFGSQHGERVMRILQFSAGQSGHAANWNDKVTNYTKSKISDGWCEVVM